MIVRYNSLNRLEPPKFTLCNPGSVYVNNAVLRPVGMLTDHEAEEIVFNFNATSELNLRVKRIPREDPEENAHVFAVYKAIQNRRLIFVDDIGYFMITSVDDGFDGSMHYKDIKAQSIDVEIQQKMVPFIPNGTYRFTTDETGTNKGILETIVETLPLWTIGFVDEAVATKWRTFEDVSETTNCLAFFLQNIQDAYECICIFDCINRTINVYSQDNYVRQTDVHITKDDFINSLDISESADDLYTAISVFGEDNVTISAINPLGSNVIYNFEYYYDWMSDGLGDKVRSWQAAIAEAMEPYRKASLGYYHQLDVVSNYQMEIDKIDTQMKMYNRCRDNIVAESNTTFVASYNEVIAENGGTAITIYPEIEDTIACIDNLIAECQSARDNTQILLNNANVYVVMYQNDADKIRESLAVANYFTADEYAELCHYIFEGSYTDEYVITTESMTYEEKFDQMQILYDRAANRLAWISQPTQEFSVDVENFIFIKEFEKWSEQLETGCLINVELEMNDIAHLFLSNMTINYDDRKLTMTFGNRFNKFDPKSLFDDMLGNISKTANTLNYIKEILYPIKSGEFNAMKEALQTSRNLSMGAALSTDNEEVIIDASGYTSRKKLDDGTYDPRQVKITGRTLVFTDDAWDTCKVAIGELLFGDGSYAYGINAETIIGDVIIGNGLQILDSSGRPLLEVVDGKITSSVGSLDERLTKVEQTSDGISIIVQDILQSGVDSVTTTTGYTFNADGLTIYKSGEDIINLVNNEGIHVSRITGETEEAILTADDEGVNALNLTARQYLIVGNNSRFEDYDNGTDEKRTACFFIGS